MPSFREKWNSPLNQAALWGLPVALVASSVLWIVLGRPSFAVFLTLAVVAWGLAIPSLLVIRKLQK
ncbi:hypothetical protein ASC89_21810 [Devosia sp. Root413D1]|uniref:hypothetical protein n=1 Tax=Devosia sp. Root413D1 TaxID=1736531 RepID=UPI0006FDF773|nr:hypothetical protein [Devosia sp. Root413D1]KQW75580.1 hypothetical protein ASC89_21810 [Devosia sp. Root413D1]